MESVEDVGGFLTFPFGLFLVSFEGFLLECLEDVLRGVHLRDIQLVIWTHCVEVVLLNLVLRLEGDVDLRDVEVLLMLRLSAGLVLVAGLVVGFVVF